MTVSDIRKKTAERMGNYGNQLPCSTCGESMSIATLSDFGARCFPCYRAYCCAAIAKPERSPAALAIRQEIAAAGKRLPP